MTSDALIKKRASSAREVQLERNEIKASGKRNDPFGAEVKVTWGNEDHLSGNSSKPTKPVFEWIWLLIKDNHVKRSGVSSSDSAE